MNLNRTIGNVLGCVAILDSLFLWVFALSTGLNELPRFRIEELLILSLILPPFAAWWASKWWLIMLLSPVAWLFAFKISI